MEKLNYCSRRFLNKDSGLAAIECLVEQWSTASGLDCSISVHDCSRSVQLDFSMYNMESLENSYRKLSLVRDEIEKFFKYITINYALLEREFKQREEDSNKEAGEVDELQR